MPSSIGRTVDEGKTLRNALSSHHPHDYYRPSAGADPIVPFFRSKRTFSPIEVSSDEEEHLQKRARTKNNARHVPFTASILGSATRPALSSDKTSRPKGLQPRLSSQVHSSNLSQPRNVHGHVQNRTTSHMEPTGRLGLSTAMSNRTNRVENTARQPFMVDSDSDADEDIACVYNKICTQSTVPALPKLKSGAKTGGLREWQLHESTVLREAAERKRRREDSSLQTTASPVARSNAAVSGLEVDSADFYASTHTGDQGVTDQASTQPVTTLTHSSKPMIKTLQNTGQDAANSDQLTRRCVPTNGHASAESSATPPKRAQVHHSEEKANKTKDLPQHPGLVGQSPGLRAAKQEKEQPTIMKGEQLILQDSKDVESAGLCNLINSPILATRLHDPTASVADIPTSAGSTTVLSKDRDVPFAKSGERVEPRKLSILEAMKKRKLADEQREAEARLRIAQRRATEEEQHLREKRRIDDQIQAARQHMDQARKDSSIIAERNDAIAKCMAAAKSSEAQDIVTGSDEASTGSPITATFRDPCVPGGKDAPAAAIQKGSRAREARIKVQKERNERRRMAEILDRGNQSPPYNIRAAYKDPCAVIESKNGLQEPTVRPQDNGEQCDNNRPCAADNEQKSCTETQVYRREQHIQPRSLSCQASQTTVVNSKQEHRQDRSSSALKALDYVSIEDLRIMEWRDQGLTWPDVAMRFEESFGCVRSHTFLRDHYNRAKEALGHNPTESINSSSRSNDLHDTRRTLPPQKKAGNGYRQNIQLAASQSLGGDLAVDKQSHLNGPDESSITVVNSETPHDIAHPRCGGKIMNEDAMRYYFQTLAEAHAELHWDTDDNVSIATEEDYCQFEYQVVRRDFTVEDLADDENNDEKQWMHCSRPLSTVCEANMAAANEIYRCPKTPPADWGSRFNLHTAYEEGLVFLEMRTESGYLVQVSVVKVLRRFDEPVRLYSNVGYAPRTVYHIKKYVTTTSKSADELFEEPPKSVRETLIDNVTFTALELANEQAIKVYVQLTFKSNSANLKVRQTEVFEREQELLKLLQEEEDGTLFESPTIGDGDETAVIKVEEGSLIGPRNIY